VEIKPKTLISRITEEQHQKLIAICNAKGITPSEWVRERIDKSKEIKEKQ